MCLLLLFFTGFFISDDVDSEWIFWESVYEALFSSNQISFFSIVLEFAAAEDLLASSLRSESNARTETIYALFSLNVGRWWFLFVILIIPNEIPWLYELQSFDSEFFKENPVKYCILDTNREICIQITSLIQYNLSGFQDETHAI
jgi:hypothetical protein